jgi:hypothetical protein
MVRNPDVGILLFAVGYGDLDLASDMAARIAGGVEAQVTTENYDPATRAEIKRHAELFRDIFGSPFHRVTVDASWLNWNFGTVPAIARHIYDERRFENMSILADALEDAGCGDAAILDHCRGSGPHVRGCWVLDLLLGKE